MDHGADDTRAVQVARLEGRVDGIERALARQEESCARRAESHVDTTLYRSERDTLRGDIGELKADIARVHVALQTSQDKIAEQRRWVIGAVVIPAIGTGVAVLMGVLS